MITIDDIIIIKPWEFNWKHMLLKLDGSIKILEVESTHWFKAGVIEWIFSFGLPSSPRSLIDLKKEQNFFEGKVTEYQKASALEDAAYSDDDL